jgi:hypothetical protein
MLLTITRQWIQIVQMRRLVLNRIVSLKGRCWEIDNVLEMGTALLEFCPERVLLQGANLDGKGNDKKYM